MDLRRLRVGEWLLALSGGALVISLFLPWYERGADRLTGWESFTVIDGMLAAVGAAALLAVVATATQPTPAVSIATESLTTLLGLAAFVLALTRVIDMPGLDPGYGAAAGAYIGLAGATGVVGGALLGMRDERLSPSGRSTDHTGRPTAGPVEIEALPPPRREGR